MLDPTVPATVTPYYGPWTVITSDDEVLVRATTQEEALRVAKAQLPDGAILAIDAGACIIRFIDPKPNQQSALRKDVDSAILQKTS